MLERKELMIIIKKNLRLLSSKEEKIIRLRFGIEENSSNTEEFPITNVGQDAYTLAVQFQKTNEVQSSIPEPG